MSVSVFAEGTFEEQLRELLDFTARGCPDDERTSILQSFQAAVTTESPPLDDARRQAALVIVLENIRSVGQGTDQEIEGFFNLLYSHLFTLWHPDSEETRRHVLYLLDVISSPPSSSPSAKYRVLSNLFNAAPQSSPLRLPIYTALLQTAAANNELDVLALDKSDVQRWLKEWHVSDDEKSQFLKTVIDTLTKAGRADSAYEYRILLVHILPFPSPDARVVAVDTITAALRIPTVFDFDSLYNLDPIIAVRDHELFSLVQIFLKGGLPEFKAWVDSHSAPIQAHELDSSQLERKIRLLVFSSLAFDYIGRDLPYATIASALQIDLSQVEKWTIDVIRAGLVSGKLSQTTRQLRVYKSSARKFEREQWEALEKRLLAWKAGLVSVIDVVALAQQRDSSVAEAAQATISEQGIQVESTA